MATQVRVEEEHLPIELSFEAGGEEVGERPSILFPVAALLILGGCGLLVLLMFATM